ncbi:MAG: formate hydrogenlyase subunit 3/multisubunit Na+/H+ antiporter MnhD subunit [Bacteroidia bacterium]|jgi:formate hydrogenlyase subunit 3/multisubunit Na+/H+ antiporter MnhD subunit
MIVNLVAAVILLLTVNAQGVQSQLLAGWPVSLAIALRADYVSSVLLVLTATIFLLTSLYALSYYTSRDVASRFWPLWLMLLVALNALFLSRDLFNLYVALELLTISAVALVAVNASNESLQAALRYLTLSLVGSLLFLAGVVLIYTRYGTLDLQVLSELVTLDLTLWIALATMSAGLALKCALFPLHFWLPSTHASATAPVSAILSALVVKAAFYLLLRLWFDLADSSAKEGATGFFGLLGAFGVLWGSYNALCASRLKLLAAYSTVAQLGYLFMFLPLIAGAPDGQASPISAAMMLFLLSHAVAKAGLFLAVGYVQQRIGHDNIDDLDGLARRLPISTFAIALAGLALIGLPPSGSFLAKWALIGALISQAHWFYLGVVFTGTLLAAAYTFRILGIALTNAGEPESDAHQLSGNSAALPSERGESSGAWIALSLVLLATVGLGSNSAELWSFMSRQG